MYGRKYFIFFLIRKSRPDTENRFQRNFGPPHNNNTVLYPFNSPLYYYCFKFESKDKLFYS